MTHIREKNIPIRFIRPLKVGFLFVILAVFGSGISLQAQVLETIGQEREFDDAFVHADTLAADSLDKALTDSASLTLPWNVPVLDIGGFGLDGCSPFYSGMYGSSWRLHEGFNAQFSLSLSAAFGKHAPKGVGFGQTAAFAYLKPITSKLSLAAGVYATNMDWGPWRQTDVGFAGIVAYQVNEHINLYTYGSKTFMPRQSDFRFRPDPFPFYLDRPRDRIGAAAEFKIGKNAMIGISVERSSY